MCTSASEVNVARSQNSTHGDDDIAEESTVLYDFSQENTYMNSQGQLQPGTPQTDERLRTFLDVIGHCQIIYDAVQQLDKKFDIIGRKVSKIERSRMKYSWYYRRLLRHSRKHHRSKAHKKAKSKEHKMSGRCGSFCHSESYSPTSPVRRPQSYSDRNTKSSSFHYAELPEGEMESLQEQEQYAGSPAHSIHSGHSRRERIRSDDIPGPQLFCSPRFPGTATFPAEISPTAPAPPLTQRDPSLTQNLDVGDLEIEPIRSSLQDPSGFATSAPIETNAAVRRQTLPDDPANWTVEHVILFLNHTDPQLSGPLTHLLRKQEIDGKALLLLNSEMVMKHMGLKLGPSLKLCHYIKKLKEEKS